MICAAGAATSANPVRGAEPAATLELRERWTNEFRGGRVARSFQVRAPAEFVGNLLWSFSSMQRTLARGEKAVQASVNAPVNIEAILDVDPSNELIMPVQFEVTLVDATGPVARHASTIWFFSRNPFTARREWISSLRMTVFDPVGKTADVLSKAQIPFTETRNQTVLSSTQGVLLIGEGIALSDFGGLSDQIMRSAAQGTLVICLAPSAGSIPLEFSPPLSPAELLFADARVIHRLDKRLDASAWAPAGTINGTRLKFFSTERAVTAQVGQEGWCWMESHFADTNGRLVFCGLPIVEKWEESPTPRYLLLRILEDLKKE